MGHRYTENRNIPDIILDILRHYPRHLSAVYTVQSCSSDFWTIRHWVCLAFDDGPCFSVYGFSILWNKGSIRNLFSMFFLAVTSLLLYNAIAIIKSGSVPLIHKEKGSRWCFSEVWGLEWEITQVFFSVFHFLMAVYNTSTIFRCSQQFPFTKHH